MCNGYFNYPCTASHKRIDTLTTATHNPIPATAIYNICDVVNFGLFVVLLIFVKIYNKRKEIQLQFWTATWHGVDICL